MASHYAEMSQRSRVTPDDVLQAARRRFLRSERVDVNELALELGVGRATLYRWFGDRDKLLGEVLWSLAEQGLAQSRKRARGRGVTWFLNVYQGFGDLIVETPSIRHFVKTEPEAALRVLTTNAATLQSRVVATFADVLEEAAATKGLVLKLDSRTLAYVLVRIAESFLWTDIITGEEPDLRKGHEVARVLLS